MSIKGIIFDVKNLTLQTVIVAKGFGLKSCGWNKFQEITNTKLFMLYFKNIFWKQKKNWINHKIIVLVYIYVLFMDHCFLWNEVTNTDKSVTMMDFCLYD